jgi:hypothetical protein
LSISDEFPKSIPVITISSNGDPVYNPSQTTDELATKAKREDIPTETIKTKAYEFFEKTKPKGVGPWPLYWFAIELGKCNLSLSTFHFLQEVSFETSNL